MGSPSSKPGSVESRISARIRRLRPGAVVLPSQFLDLGARGAVDVALHRLARSGLVHRVARGMYHYPEVDPQLGRLSPSTDSIADALRRRYSIRLQPTGAYSANVLGLCDQVPMRVAFLTDGPSRKLVVGKRSILLRHTTPRNMATAGTASGLVIQALRWLGRRYVDEAIVTRLKKLLRSEDKRRLSMHSRLAPEWISRLMREIASTAGPNA